MGEGPKMAKIQNGAKKTQQREWQCSTERVSRVLVEGVTHSGRSIVAVQKEKGVGSKIDLFSANLKVHKGTDKNDMGFQTREK